MPVSVNGNPVVLYIVTGVIAVVILSIIAYYVARVMKGSMKITTDKKSFGSGETIEGQLHVTVKKPVDVDRLYIALIGEREHRSRSSNGNSSTSWKEFYRDEGDILTDEHLRAGFSEVYLFGLEAPSVPTVEGQMDSIAEGMESATAKTIVKGIGQLASLSNKLGGRRRWRVVGRLETKGVDLAASRKVHVSLG